MHRILVMILLLLGITLPVHAQSSTEQQLLPLTIDTDTSATCTITISPGQSIQNAFSNATQGSVICLRGGTYSEFVRIASVRPGVTLQSYPGEWAVLDGQKRIPDSYLAPLIRVEANNTVLQNFEIRHSAGRGVAVEYPGQNVILRNLKIHDNWQGGIVIKGNGIFGKSTDGAENYVRGVRIENSEIYDNIRKGKDGMVIHRAARSGTAATGWTYDPNSVWDNPIFRGVGTDIPDKTAYGMSLRFEGSTLRTIYITTSTTKSRYIGAAYTANGAEIAYEGRDVLRMDPATRKWGLALDGAQFGLATSAVIDAIHVEPQSGCSGCYPLLLSFAKAVTLNGAGQVGPADIVKFTPTAVNAGGQYTAGSFSIAGRATDIGLRATDNIDALARWTDGRMVMSLAGSYQLSGRVVGRGEDLFLYNPTAKNWSLFFDSSDVALNPFPNDGTSVSFDAAGNIYTGGDVVGGSAVAFVESQDSGAYGNKIYRNYGEGLVADRASDRITFNGNTIWDNNHANIYLNVTTNPVVKGNFVYCTDDRRFWNKAANRGASAGPGIAIRDELFGGSNTSVSSGQVIINNIVTGCSPNFIVDSQVPNGGLRNATVANNSFINGRGEPNASINNVLFIGGAVSYANSSFRNNLIVQNVAGNMVRAQGTLSVGSLVVSNNLYSQTPPSGWFSGEAGRVVGAPLLENPVLPTSSAAANPAWYTLKTGSPAIDRAVSVPLVPDDFFRQVRTGTPDIGADER